MFTMATPTHPQTRVDATANTDTTRSIDSPWPGAYTINHYRQGRPRTHTHRHGGPSHIGVYPGDESDHLITDWCDHGRQHRVDGPALTLSNGDILWIVEGRDITYVSPA